MSNPVSTIVGHQLVVQIGDGATTEVFNPDCLINTERGISFKSDTKEFVIADCDDPSAPGWKEVETDGMQATIKCAGMVHSNSIKTWFNWFSTGVSKRVRFRNNVLLAKGGGYFAGSFKLTEFEETGSDRKDKATFTGTLVSTGIVTWVDAAA